ncbi:GNAT family N-acetyltransferase [Chryseobacterium paridis]|uniref:GNAT family N-acetyltransferase n=1 Tax=Chryseobacterium paridis TaxID=2800328 RepID=A0ABS1FTU8_9FLAO|nr:hypothetical protein [Chryseobacterium paridis]MBK1895829.1 hypothetical protein [Chryseobacterium paridis]
MIYSIKKPEELTAQEIETIIALWENEEWMGMEVNDFKILFKDSEFHLLLDLDEKIASVLRLNFDFNLKISDHVYSFAELGGFASVQKGKGNGSQLLQHSMNTIVTRDLQTIGFCLSDVRPFYEKCNVPILYDKAKYIQEKDGGDWVPSEDDDILIIHLSEENNNLFQQLDLQQPAYLIQ